jgi:hypothetical protein
MGKQKKNEAWQGRAGVSACGLIALAAAIANPAHAESDFQPRIGFLASWMDNIELAPPDQPQREDMLLQITPGFRLSQVGQRLNGFLDYEAQALFSKNESDSNTVYHHLDAGGHYDAIQNWLYVDAAAGYYQSVIDPRGAGSQNNTFRTDNTTNTASFMVTPTLLHDFGRATLNAFYTRGLVDYQESDRENEAVEDSDNEGMGASLYNSDSNAVVGWSLSYRRDKAEYDIDEITLEKATAELSYGISRTLRLIGRGGSETDPAESASNGGLDSTFYGGGFSWKSGEGNELQVIAGHRFFGTSYEGMARRRTRIADLEVHYQETPTTEAQRFGMRFVADPVNPLPPNDNFGRITPDVYVLKLLTGRINFEGRVTQIAFDVSAESREYILLDGITDRARSVGALFARQLGPRTRAELLGRLTRVDVREGGDYEDTNYTVRLSRRLATRANLTLTGTRLDRSGGVNSYRANWVELGLEMTF